MGYEERCDKQADDLPEVLTNLALAARTRSWEPDRIRAWRLLMACVDLAGELADYVREDDE